jgi:tetratricopeptide (TPR) repeat protein
MQRFALKEQASIELNPKIRWLLAEPPRAAGLRLLEDGKSEEARPLLEQAVEIRGKYKDHVALLRAYRQLGDHRRVIRTATRCLEMDPNDAWLYMQRAVAYVSIHQNERALADADRAVECASEDPAIAYNRAFVIHSALGQNAAIPAYEKILVIDPNFRPALDKLNGIFREQKRYREAEPLARRVTELFPNDADAWFTYAGVLYCLKDPNAKAALKRFLDLADRRKAEDRKRVEYVENLLAAKFGGKPAAPEASGG